jgi:hypothetical protein
LKVVVDHRCHRIRLPSRIESPGAWLRPTAMVAY